MANENESTIEALEREHQHAEALTNAIYVTILILAALGIIETDTASAEEVLAEGLVALIVLFIVHLYSSWLAAETTHASALAPGHIGSVVRAQLPLLVAAVVPVVSLGLAAAGAFSLRIAVTASIVYGIAFLFVLSGGLALRHGRSRGVAVMYGLGGAALGLVVGLEVSLHH